MKKNIVLISLVMVLSIFVFDNVYKIGICEKGDVSCHSTYINLGESLLFFIPVFLFSLITYFAPEYVFASWWKFARITIPAIFIPVLLINMEVHHNPNGDWQDIFDLQALILLYGIFILGSAWQIWKGWRSK